MTKLPILGALLILGGGLAACDKLGVGEKPPVPDVPTDQQLARIAYMTAADPGAKGRKQYSHYEEAKTCGDFELAMRWNRPPNVPGGAFNKKLIYVTPNMPADLPKDSEVFLAGRIEKGETLTSGSAGWYLRLKDGTLVQAIETADYWEKEEQQSQDGKLVAIVKPDKPGRALCGQAVYQGLIGKDPGQDAKIPLFSLLFAMDRGK